MSQLMEPVHFITYQSYQHFARPNFGVLRGEHLALCQRNWQVKTHLNDGILLLLWADYAFVMTVHLWSPSYTQWMEPLRTDAHGGGKQASSTTQDTLNRASATYLSTPPPYPTHTPAHVHSCHNSGPASDDDEFEWFFDGSIDSQPPPKPDPTISRPSLPLPSSLHAPAAPSASQYLDEGLFEQRLALLGSGLAHAELVEMEMAVAAAILQTRAPLAASVEKGPGTLEWSPTLRLEPDRVHVHAVVGLARDASFVMPGNNSPKKGCSHG